MIDDKAAAAKVEAMHKANAENLVRALAVERYLFTVFEHKELDTAYNPEVMAVRVLYRVKGENALRNVVECVKRGAGEAPLRVVNGEVTHMMFSGGFSIVVAKGVN
jgi:hypothetical protein